MEPEKLGACLAYKADRCWIAIFSGRPCNKAIELDPRYYDAYAGRSAARGNAEPDITSV
jgi:hypothetical protein